VRLVPGFTGICFLCWPNLAYHLTNLFVEWPSTEGRVDSAAQEGSRSVITYSFELGQNTFGGAATLKSSDVTRYSEGQPITVAYDPLNPDQSKVLPRTTVEPLNCDSWRDISIALFDSGRKSGPILGERNRQIVSVDNSAQQSGLVGRSRRRYCSFAYSPLASFRTGMLGSALFQRVRKSWYALFALAMSPVRT
jgi:hypothetical protein